MKVRTQNSFPTLLRTTAQGAIITIARVFAAWLVLYTPQMMDSNPKGLFYLLAGIRFVGLVVAWFGFIEDGINDFEGQICDEVEG